MTLAAFAPLAGVTGIGSGGGIGGLPLSASSSASSRAGPVSVGGLTFMPGQTDTISNSVIVIAALAAVVLLARR